MLVPVAGMTINELDTERFWLKLFGTVYFWIKGKYFYLCLVAIKFIRSSERKKKFNSVDGSCFLFYYSDFMGHTHGIVIA